MKLISCYVENFGRLHQFSMEFTEGFNLIHAENGWGKTTLSVFLKSMFFGMEYSPKKKLSGNERRLYQPWQGGNYGGYVIFSHNNKTYKVERFFGTKDKEDTFALYDQKTGLPSLDFTENIGEELFEVDRDSFAMSMYFPQNELPVSMSDSINAKINDVDAFGGDIDRYEAAIALLDERLKEYKKTGNRGLLGEWENRLAFLNQKMEEGVQNEKVRAERQKQLCQVRQKIWMTEDKISALRQQEKALEEAKTRQASAGHLEHLKQQLARDQEKIRPLKDFFKGGVPSEEDIEQLIRLEEKKKELEKFPSEELLMQSEEQLEKDQALLAQLQQEFGDKVPDEESFAELKKLADAMKLSERRIQKRLSAYTEARKRQQHILQEKGSHKHQQQKKDTGILVVWAAALVVLLLGAVFAAPLRIPCIALALAICLLFGGYKLGLIGKHENEASFEAEDEAQDLQAELEKLQEIWQKQKRELSQNLSLLGIDVGEDPAQQFEIMQLNYARYKEQQARVADSEQKYQKLEAAKKEYLVYKDREIRLAQQEKLRFSEKYRMNLSFWNLRTLMDIRERKHEYESLLEEYEAHKKQLAEFEAANPAAGDTAGMDFTRKSEETDIDLAAEKNSDKVLKIQNAVDDNFNNKNEIMSKENLEAQIASLEAERQQLIRARESYRRDIEILTAKVEEAEECRQESLKLRETYEEGKNRADLLQKTMKYLKEAKDRFSTRYMDRMRAGFSKYMGMIDPAAASRMQLDVTLHVKEESDGSLHEDTYLSTGMAEFAGICTRLALVEAMYEGEKPFLILDDPFVNLDEEKVTKGRELLDKLSETYQILYFTCHESRA